MPWRTRPAPHGIRPGRRAAATARPEADAPGHRPCACLFLLPARLADGFGREELPYPAPRCRPSRARPCAPQFTPIVGPPLPRPAAEDSALRDFSAPPDSSGATAGRKGFGVRSADFDRTLTARLHHPDPAPAAAHQGTPPTAVGGGRARRGALPRPDREGVVLWASNTSRTGVGRCEPDRRCNAWDQVSLWRTTRRVGSVPHRVRLGRVRRIISAATAGARRG
jgi:hypothetical protein